MYLRKRLWPDCSEKNWSDYRWQLANRLKGPEGLSRLLDLDGKDIEPYRDCLDQYKWASTPYYISLMGQDYHEDPVGLQIIPGPEETTVQSPHSSKDPLAEHGHSPLPGLIHRYLDRVVVLASGFCASYCRHCNRKRTWKHPEAVSDRDSAWNDIRSYIKGHPRIREVLISGGDPLLLPPGRLERILQLFTSLPGVEVLRIGTRLPVVLPMAVTEELCSMLRKYRPLWLNTHFNHPREITPESQGACERLQLAGIPVSNQSVLLKGVNDDFSTMKELCCTLQKIMVRPYYLFHCDFVEGTDHFRTDIKKGIDIIERMWGDTGGMCIPDYVVDLPDGMGKARVVPSHLKDIKKDTATFQTFEGNIVRLQIN